MPMAVAAGKARPNKYEKSFGTVAVYLVHRGKRPMTIIKVVYVAQVIHAKKQKTRAVTGTFRGRIK